MSTKNQPIDQQKLEAFLGKMVGDLGATLSMGLAWIGDKLGLYKAMSQHGPMTSEELAKKTGTNERYVREWLIHQAASGWAEYDPTTKKYALPPEHAIALTDEDSPFFLAGGFQVCHAMAIAQSRIVDVFKSGEGMLWGEHDPELFRGTERFFRASYLGNLVGSWIPSLDGAQKRLEAGATVADVGCGRGASTIIMGKAFPKSRFYGFDNHEPSVDSANKAARDAGVSDRVKFQKALAQDYPNHSFDLICFFDCLHDMGDPIGACKHARQALKPDGYLMIIEPMAGKNVEGNFNMVGRLYSGASVLCCSPNAMASGGYVLGTVASDDALAEVVTAGGFTRFRRATETPFNRVFEARP